jgi:hypothetical protein
LEIAMFKFWKNAAFCGLAVLLSCSVTILAQDVTITVKKGSETSIEVAKSRADELAENEKAETPFAGVRSAVDVAILLDTSNSMDGLIDQARSQLWTIVQQFARAEKEGKTPELRVTIFEYGNSGLPASEGYIRQVVQLTDDLDKVSEALFALKTNGGDRGSVEATGLVGQR